MSAPAGIVLVHGYTGSAVGLQGIANRLVSRFGPDAVATVPLPGHDGPQAPPFDERAFLDAIAAAAERFANDGRGLVLIGHSTGGCLLRAFLLERNIQPRLLVLAASPRTVTAQSLSRWSLHRAGRREVPFSSVASLVSFINRSGAVRVGGLFPVLSLCAGADMLVPPEEASWGDGAFEGPVRDMTVPSVGHHLFEGSGSTMALEIVERAVADAMEVLSADDREVLRLLREAEPESAAFMDRSPLSLHHISRSAAGCALAGKHPVLSERAETEPIIANIEITTHCNLSCVYCARAFRDAPPEDMPLGRFKQALSLLPHAYRVTLVGLGEPLLHPDLAAIVAAAAAEGRRVGLVTNAMLLDGATGEELLDAGLSSIAFSIDAADEKLAQKLRPGSDLVRIMANIRAFTAAARKRDRPVATAVFTAVSQDNIAHLDAVVDLVATFGVHVMMMTDLNFEENSAHTIWKGADSEAGQRLRQAVSRAFGQKLPVLSVHGLEEFGLAKRYDRYLLLPPDSLGERSKERTWCFSPWQTIPVNVRGEVTVCDCQPDESAGNLFETPFTEIWNGQKMMDCRTRMVSANPPERCLLCPRF